MYGGFMPPFLGEKSMMNHENVNTNQMVVKRTTAKDAPSKKELEAERAKDHEIVRGIFRFHEVPNGTMNFVFRKWKFDEVLHYSFRDGEIYSIPLMVAKHLNKNCWYPIHDFQVDEFGKFINQFRISKRVRRCSFQSLEFVDTDDIMPVGDATIYTAEQIGS